jgi:hypothetical protein
MQLSDMFLMMIESDFLHLFVFKAVLSVASSRDKA